MLDVLTRTEIDDLLRRQYLGRLGIWGEGRVYVFPMSYGYDGKDFYCHSHVGRYGGQKVQLMRAQPEVCLEVEEITAPGDWRTVLVHGQFEEITDAAERDAALARIAAQAGRPYSPSLAPYVGGPEALVVYRLRVTEMTGRAEQEPIYDWPFGTAPAT